MKIGDKSSYYYFDENNKLKIRELNRLERFLRNFFGLYKSTHLSNVVSQGYKITLQGQSDWVPEDRQSFLQLVTKVHGAYFQLPQFDLPSGAKMQMQIRYNVQTNAILQTVDARLKAEGGAIYDMAFMRNDPELLELEAPVAYPDGEHGFEKVYHTLTAEMIEESLGKQEMPIVVKLPQQLFNDQDEKMNERQACVCQIVAKVVQQSGFNCHYFVPDLRFASRENIQDKPLTNSIIS